MSTDAAPTPPATARPSEPVVPRSLDLLFLVARLAPYRLLGSPKGQHVFERNVLLWRNQWPALLSGLFEPLLYLLVLGVGVGSLVDGTADLGGAAYGEFVAAGLLGAAAMNATVYETYNVYFKLRHDGIYDAMGATPAAPRDIAAGEIVWAVSRVALYAVGFMVVAAALGVLASPLALLAIPVALLIGFTFAALTLWATTYMRSWNDFDLLQIAIVPLFLFSATFYPISVLPTWAQVITQISPLYHGVAALRQVMLGQVDVWIVAHLGVLVVLGLIGFRLGARRFVVLLRT